MGKYTEKLNLYLTDTTPTADGGFVDGNDVLNFDRDFNDNFQKIDDAVAGLDNASLKKDLSNLPVASEDYIRAVTDGRYTPVDLTVKHATEIANNHAGDAWAWIASRIRSANFSGIHVGDYIPVKLTGGTIGGAVTIPANQQHYMQVAGIDTYYKCGDTEIPHHIDFIALNTIEACSMWNEGNTSNGTSAEKNPFRASRIFAICNGVNNYSTSAQGSLKHGLNCSSGGILQMLPASCRNVLIEKRMWAEELYNASQQIFQPSGHGWINIGKVWIPHEVEVCGYQPNSYSRSGDNLTRGTTKMYPLFRYQNREKTGANTGARSHYWLTSPSGYSATNVANVRANGGVDQNNATYTTISVCFGFRVA